MKSRLLKQQSGFTLVELLIVMVILGILATLGIGGFQSSQLKGRDARRKSDLKQMTNALETYYNDKGQYPLSSVDFKIQGCANGSTCQWGDQFIDENDTVYMVELPDDPKAPGRNYHYVSTNGRSYQIYARLENNLDADVHTGVGDAPQVYSGISCGNASCNYGVASSNTAPETGRTLVNE